MKVFFLCLFSLAIGSCTNKVNLPNNNISSSKPSVKTSIFTYDVSPTTYAQPAASITGTLIWKDGCIYIEDNGKYSTVLLPAMPKGLFHWDEATKTLSLGSHKFEMGDFIRTNGGTYRYVANGVGIKNLKKQGDKKCLTPELTKLGTNVVDLN